MMYGLFGGMWVNWLLGIGLIVLVIWIILQNMNTKNPRQNSEENALEILKKRYAKGEITKAEFEEMKKDLDK